MKHVHETIKDIKKFSKVVDRLLKLKMVGLDLETEGFEWWGKHFICGVGLGCVTPAAIYTCYVPVRHCDLEGVPYINDNLSPSDVSSVLSPLVMDPDIRIVGANTKFDAHFLREDFGLKTTAIDDVQVMARLLRTEYRAIGLKKLIPLEFDNEHVEDTELKAWFRKNKIKCNQKYVEPQAYAKAPIEQVSKYCGKDVYWTLMLALKYLKELKADKKLLSVYEKIERPLIPTVMNMEKNGITINVNYLQDLKEQLTQEAADLEVQIYVEAGQKFNPSSTQQLREVLEPMGVMPELRKRKNKDGETTSESLDAAVLEKNRKEHLICDLILRYRETTKTLGTYVNNVLDRIDPEWDSELPSHPIIHASIRQDSARTGRMSISDPPLQTLPREEK
jgi:DNA polymerase-1